MDESALSCVQYICNGTVCVNECTSLHLLHKNEYYLSLKFRVIFFYKYILNQSSGFCQYIFSMYMLFNKSVHVVLQSKVLMITIRTIKFYSLFTRIIE